MAVSTVDSADREIVVTRTFDAPPELVLGSFTETPNKLR